MAGVTETQSHAATQAGLVQTPEAFLMARATTVSRSLRPDDLTNRAHVGIADGRQVLLGQIAGGREWVVLTPNRAAGFNSYPMGERRPSDASIAARIEANSFSTVWNNRGEVVEGKRYRDFRPIQTFQSSMWKGRSFELYQAQNPQGKWEVRAHSLEPNRRDSDMLVFTSNRPVTDADFARGGPVVRNLARVVREMNAPDNVTAAPPAKTGNLWDATVGVVTGAVGQLARGGVVGVPEALGRNAAALGGNVLALIERGADAVTGGNRDRDGFSNPLRTEQRAQFAQTNRGASLVQNTQDRVARWAGADPDTVAFKGGDFVGGLLTLFRFQKPGRITQTGEAQQRALFRTLVKDAPADQLIAGARNLNPEQMKRLATRYPQEANALANRLESIARTSGRADVAQLARDIRAGGPMPTGGQQPGRSQGPQPSETGPLATRPAGPTPPRTQPVPPQPAPSQIARPNEPLAPRAERPGLPPAPPPARPAAPPQPSPEELAAQRIAASVNQAERIASDSMRINGKSPRIFAPGEEAAMTRQALAINRAGDAARAAGRPGDVALAFTIRTDQGDLVPALFSGTPGEVRALMDSPAFRKPLADGHGRAVVPMDLARAAGRTPESIARIEAAGPQTPKLAPAPVAQTPKPAQAPGGEPLAKPSIQPAIARQDPAPVTQFPTAETGGGGIGKVPPRPPTTTSPPGDAANGPNGGGHVGPVEKPRLLTAAERSAGDLSVTFGMNLNPTMRRVLEASRSGAAPLPPYAPTLTDSQAAQAAASALTQGGLSAEAAAAAPEIAKLAKAIDADPAALGRAIAADVTAVRQAANAISPQNPILVDSVRDPESVERARASMSALMSQGTPKAQGWRTVTLQDGSQAELFFRPGIRQTVYHGDIDGVEAPSYGVEAFDLAVSLPDGRTGHLFLRLDRPLGGEIARTHGVSYRGDRGVAEIDADVKSAQTGRTERRTIEVPVSQEQGRILAQATNAEAMFVEGLGARYFPPSSLNFLRLASRNAESGNRTLGTVELPEVALNTFGTALDPTNPKAFRGSPAQLVTSIARSLGFEETIEPVPNGFYAIPGIKVYSGGTSITQGARLLEPFGLSPGQAVAFQRVAESIRPLIDELASAFDLSDAARSALRESSFANPDIPSVIFPASLIEELKHRTQATHPGRTLADLQRHVDERLQTLIRENGLERVVTLHHTPTGSSPGKPDDVAYHDPARPTDPLTSEWQLAVNGQKALPVMDDVAGKLMAHHGIDLKRKLEAQGWSYGRIREMSLDETITFFRDVVRPMITNRGVDLGKIVIGVDTYAEKNGKPGGSDASMIRAAQALYGAQNVVVVQVDTFSGNPGAGGRNPAFSLGLGGPGLELTRPSVDAAGPNGAIAPRFYVTRPHEFGTIMNGALRDQSGLTPEEWRVRVEGR